MVGGATVRRDVSRAEDGRLVPRHGHQPRLWLRVGRLSRVLVLRNSPPVSVPGDGSSRLGVRDSDARSDQSHRGVVRRQHGRHLRQLRAVRSLRRVKRWRIASVRTGVCCVRRVRCADRRYRFLRRQRTSSSAYRAHQG